MKVQEIAKRTTLGDEQSLTKALDDLKSTSDSDLHFYLVLRDTLNATAADTRKAITLAQVEWERRKKEETRSLAYRTTVLSGFIGILGVILGALLTQWLVL